MPPLMALGSNQATQNPGFESAMVLTVVLLGVLATVMLVVTFFWLNRRRPGGIHQAGSYSRPRDPREGLDPWAEAGRRLDPHEDPDWMHDPED